jgi:phosphoribosyl-dephospho-CoA transferase
MQYRPHDLVFLRQKPNFDSGEIWPAWLDPAWLEQAPMVVRRATTKPGMVPVGARGLRRNQRCAGEVASDDVARLLTPEMLAVAVLQNHILDFSLKNFGENRTPDSTASFSCIDTLLCLAPRLKEIGLAWGPVGGVGFWLATRLPVLRTTSDLDLLVRSPIPLTPYTLAALYALQNQAFCRIDIQVDTGVGGFAINEYARGGKVLLKTCRGPFLLTDPWEARANP